MAGDRQIFQEAMAQGQNFAAAEQWDRALREYIRAAKEIPNDLTARAAVAQALFRLERYDQALPQFQALVKVNPKDIESLRFTAEIFAKTGRVQEAIEVFQRLRDIAINQSNDIARIEALSDIIALDPHRIDAYLEIIETYQNMGDNKSAAAVALELSRYYISQERYDDALRTLEDAEEIDPDNLELTQLKASLENGDSMTELPDIPDIDLDENLPELPDIPDYNEETEVMAQPAYANVSTSSPTLRQASTQTNPDEFVLEAERALEQGETGRALRQYEQAIEAGANDSAIFYSIGQLYAQENMLNEAEEALTRAAEDPDYAASAYFALGGVYEKKGNLEHAGDTYEQALMLIDLQQIGEGEVDELIEMYNIAANVFEQQGNTAKAANLYTNLQGYLQSQNFRTEKSTMVMIRARELTDEVVKKKSADGSDGAAVGGGFAASISFGSGGDGVITNNEDNTLAAHLNGNGNGHGENLGAMTDLNADLNNISRDSGLALFGDKEPITSHPPVKTVPAVFPAALVNLEPNMAAMPFIRAAEDFLRRDLTAAAIDACHEIIRFFPEYLPAQVILAEVYVRKGWLEQARTKYQFVVDLYQIRNESTKAIEAYKRLAEISPDNTGLRSKLANLMMANGQQEQAAEILLSNVENYARNNQIEKAIEECRKLRNLAPNSAPIRVQYGELLIRIERFSEALADLRRAIELEPQNLKALCLLNITLFVSGEGDGDARWGSFKAVIDRANENSETMMQVLDTYRSAYSQQKRASLSYALGCINLEMKQIATALRLFEETLKAATLYSEQNEYEIIARWELGQAYIDLNRLDEAVTELGKVINLLEAAEPRNYAPMSMRYGALPAQALIYRRLAQAFNKQGQTEFALKSLKKVKQLVPYDRGLYFELAELHFEQGQLNEALAELGELAAHYEQTNNVEAVIDVLKEMQRLAPNKIEVRDKLSQVYLNRGMIDEGLAELDELSDLQRKNGRIKDGVRTLQRAAEIYWMMQRQDKAYELYDRIVHINPGDIEARQQLVNLHILAGRSRDAADEQRAIATICLQNNNTQEAIAALHQVIQLDINDTRAYFQLASVLSGIGEYGQSYRLYSRILRLEPDNEKTKVLQAQAKQKAIQAGQLQEKKKE